MLCVRPDEYYVQNVLLLQDIVHAQLRKIWDKILEKFNKVTSFGE